jgi:hypothetical protein
MFRHVANRAHLITKEESCTSKTTGRISHAFERRIVGGCSDNNKQPDRTMQINASISLPYVRTYTGYKLPRNQEMDPRSLAELWNLVTALARHISNRQGRLRKSPKVERSW